MRLVVLLHWKRLEGKCRLTMILFLGMSPFKTASRWLYSVEEIWNPTDYFYGGRRLCSACTIRTCNSWSFFTKSIHSSSTTTKEALPPNTLKKFLRSVVWHLQTINLKWCQIKHIWNLCHLNFTFLLVDSLYKWNILNTIIYAYT